MCARSGWRSSVIGGGIKIRKRSSRERIPSHEKRTEPERELQVVQTGVVRGLDRRSEVQLTELIQDRNISDAEVLEWVGSRVVAIVGREELQQAIPLRFELGIVKMSVALASSGRRSSLTTCRSCHACLRSPAFVD